jgi:NAD(P)-dependent dehydrogenase (short-subunit alcohol dehydrogenase family)
MGTRLAGKVAVITGGASGFGEATCRRFVEEGARVVVADIQDPRGATLASELGEAARYRRTDVTREEDVRETIDFAVSEFGQLDCVFNNAGIVGAIGPIDETPIEEYDATMAVLLRGAFLGTKHAARVMKPRRSGVILSTSSVAGLMGGLGPHVYAMAKAALIGLTRNAAAELAPFNIRPDAVAPAADALALMSPLTGRAGVAEDIAEAALWLASDAAGYVSGHTLTVDGGLTTGSANPIPPLFQKHSPMLRERGRRGV